MFVTKYQNQYLNDEERRDLIFKGLAQEEYHHYFDKLQKDHQREKGSKITDQAAPAKGRNDNHEQQIRELTVSRSSWTIQPTDCWYRTFHYIKILCCLFSVLFYPQMIIRGFQATLTPNKLYVLVGVVETIFLFDIIIGFFLQQPNEDGVSR